MVEKIMGYSSLSGLFWLLPFDRWLLAGQAYMPVFPLPMSWFVQDL